MNHGTAAGYLDRGCRCPECGRWNYLRTKRYRLRTGAGESGVPKRPLTVDVQPVRDHVDSLVASGWMKKDIAEEVGRTVFGLYSLLYHVRSKDGSKRIRRDIADAILAVEPLPDLTNYVDGARVDRLVAGYPDAPWPDGTTRPERLAALARLDYRTMRAASDQLSAAELPSMSRALAYLRLRSDDAAALATAVAS